MDKELTEHRTNRCRTTEGINSYRVNSRTDNDVTYLGGVLKIEFRKGKISRIASHSQNSRKFCPTKISCYTVCLPYSFMLWLYPISSDRMVQDGPIQSANYLQQKKLENDLMCRYWVPMQVRVWVGTFETAMDWTTTIIIAIIKNK